MTDSNRTSPLINIAAVAVILLSGVGVAKMMNWLPGSTPATAEAATTPATDKGDKDKVNPGTQDKKDEKQTETKVAQTKSHSTSHHAGSAHASQAATSCARCGVVTSVTPIAEAAQPSGLGAMAGAILGGVIGHQIGNGKGRDVAAVAGALGGGYAGNSIEGKVRAHTTYRVSVRFEDGHNEHFTYPQDPGVAAGTPVREENGQLIFR